MRKAPEAFRTISETADALDTPAHVLRFWESKFSQVKPVKRAGGRRYYRPTDIDLLSGIRTLLHDQGMTIRGVQKLLQEKGVRHVAALAPLTGEVLDGSAVPALGSVAGPSAADPDTADTATTRSTERRPPKPRTKPDEIPHAPVDHALQTRAPQPDAASAQDTTAKGITPSVSSHDTPTLTVPQPDHVATDVASTGPSVGVSPEDDAPDLPQTEVESTEKPAANAEDTPSTKNAEPDAPQSEHVPNRDPETIDEPAAPDGPTDRDRTLPADASENSAPQEDQPAPALGPLLEGAAEIHMPEVPNFARIAHALRNSQPQSMERYAPATARLEALVARMSARAD